jgi:hypothetical protein
MQQVLEEQEARQKFDASFLIGTNSQNVSPNTPLIRLEYASNTPLIHL